MHEENKVNSRVEDINKKLFMKIRVCERKFVNTDLL